MPRLTHKDDSFQAITCTGTNKRKTKHTNKPNIVTLHAINWHEKTKDKKPLVFKYLACTVLTTNIQGLNNITNNNDPHSRTLSGSDLPHHRWQSDRSRHQCITTAQKHSGHATLLASYLHHIGRQDSATCPDCNGAEETAEHPILQCLTHDQICIGVARRVWGA